MVEGVPYGASPWAPRLDKFILEDLIDIFVSLAFVEEKDIVMTLTPAVVQKTVGDGVKDGFRQDLAQGEGRYRHFFMNAIAVCFSPDFIVNLAARITGGDFGQDDPDVRADVTSNEKGREFGRFLHQLLEDRRLDDGTSVEDHIRECFGDGSPRPPLPQPPGTVSVSIGSPALSFTHIVGVTECPQKVGTYTLENVGTISVEISIVAPRPVFVEVQEKEGVETTMTEALLDPGESVEVCVFFDCTTAESFEARIDNNFLAFNNEEGSLLTLINGTVQRP